VTRNIFNCLLKEATEVAVVTLVGRLLHARAAVTRKERSPMVRSRVLGTVVIKGTPLRQSIEDRGGGMGAPCCYGSGK